MKVLIAAPASPISTAGNRVTALRWQRHLQQLGHEVMVVESHASQIPRDDSDNSPDVDLLVALHARKSANTISEFAREHPTVPRVVALAGTDLYTGEEGMHADTLRSLELAHALVVLQVRAVQDLPARFRDKAHVIHQSFAPLDPPPEKPTGIFQVAVIGHLREVKDPFRAALAADHLSAESTISIEHLGQALSPEFEQRAQELQRSQPRYHWRGAVSREQARRVLAESHLLVMSSWTEGGANVVSESMVFGVPVLASRVSGNIGLLGEEYSGYFTAGDSLALARLMGRTESDPTFLEELRSQVRLRAPLFTAEAEQRSWQKLLQSLVKD